MAMCAEASTAACSTSRPRATPRGTGTVSLGAFRHENVLRGQARVANEVRL